MGETSPAHEHQGRLRPGNSQPLSLDQQGVAWRIESGYLDLFAVPYRQGQVAGMRLHLFRLDAGDLLFRLPAYPHNEGEIRFLARGMVDTVVREIPLAELTESSPDWGAETGRAVDHWAASLLQAILATPFHKLERVATLGSNQAVIPLQAGSQITAAKDLLWLTTLEGRLVYAGRGLLDTGGFTSPLPLTHGGRMHVMTDKTRVEALTTAAYLATHGTLPDLSLLAHLFGQVASARFLANAEQSRQRSRAHRNDDDKQLDGALRNFAAILEQRPPANKWQGSVVMKREYLFWLAMLFLLALCAFWFGQLIQQTARDWQFRRQAASYRAKTLRHNPARLRVGVAAANESEHDKAFWNGIEMAAREINQNGGVLGKPLELIERNDQGRIDTAREIAQEFAEDMTVSAVIGHRFSHVTLATAVIYEYYGLLMLCPRSTSPKLTENGYRRVFQSNVSGTVFGEQMAEFAKRRGWQRIIILYLDDEYGKGEANAFERRADELDLTMVDRHAHNRSITIKEMNEIMSVWKANRDFDAIVMVTLLEYGADFIRVARKHGIEQPMILSEPHDSDDLLAKVGLPPPALANLCIASVYAADAHSPKARPFAEAYAKLYGQTPDGLAAQAYDAVYLIAEAAKQANSFVPDEMAAALRQTKAWMGVTGPHTFTAEGGVSKPIQFKVIREGRLTHYHVDEQQSCPKQPETEADE